MLFLVQWGAGKEKKKTQQDTDEYFYFSIKLIAQIDFSTSWPPKLQKGIRIAKFLPPPWHLVLINSTHTPQAEELSLEF